METIDDGRKPWPRWLYWWLGFCTVAILAAVGYFGRFIFINGHAAAMGRETVLLTQAASHDNELLPSRPAPTATVALAIPTCTVADAGRAHGGCGANRGPTAPPLRPTATARSHAGERATLPMQSPEYGMQAFLWWRPETAHRDLA